LLTLVLIVLNTITAELAAMMLVAAGALIVKNANLKEVAV